MKRVKEEISNWFVFLFVAPVILFAGAIILFVDYLIERALIKLHIRKKPVYRWTPADEEFKRIPWG